ncbi:MAG: T9SS type A sorting domain-containing protein [Saprospiraceae bacterium]
MKIFRPFLFFLLVFSTSLSLSAQDIIWPGDVNNNGQVTEVDLLFLGLGYGLEGQRRKETNSNWTEQAGNPWATSAVGGLDLAFADCNGDGTIDANDVNAIKDNFGKMHTDGTSLRDEILLATVGIDPAFSIPNDTNLEISPSTESITIPIHLGNDTLSIESLLGISFSIRVNGQVFEESATTFQLNGWLPSDNSELIRNENLPEPVTSNDPEKYIVAYTKTNQLASTGSGLIGELTLTPGFVVIGDVPDFRVTIDSITLIDVQRNLTPVVGTEIILNPVHFLDSTSATTTICQGESYDFNNTILTESGIYRDTLQNIYGRDSIIILDLAIIPSPAATINETICQGETYLFGGDTLRQAGTYTKMLQAFNGCDSATTLALAVLDTLQTVIEKTICQGDSFEFKGEFLTAAGNYRDTLTAANGCNQYVVLNLAVNDTLQSVIDRTICQGDMFSFNEQTLMDAGTYRDTFIAANGCDQYVVLNLSVAEQFQTMLTQSICQGEAYLFGDVARVESGVYQQALSAINGCDSVVTLNLTVNDIGETTINQTICESAVYDFNGQNLATAGIYRDTLSNVNGCDSFVILTLKISDRFETELNEAICVGESMSFNGQTIETSGSYQQDFVATNGCDSMVTLNLTVNTTDFTALSEEICAGSSRSFNGHNLSETGTYLDTLRTQNGCDSMVELTLTVSPMIESTSEQTICAGDTIEFHTFILTKTNSYTTMLKTAEGCDSMVILNLQVLETIETIIEEMLCPQDSLLFGDDMLTEAGVYTQNLLSIDGCDSTVTLNLTMGVAGAGGCQSVSIEEEFLQSIEIYPNPVRQSLFIDSPTVPLNHIRLINLTGQVLKAQTFNRGNSPTQQEINMQDVVSGVYWVLIQTEYGLRQKKIVKF